MRNIYILPEHWHKASIGACGWVRLLEPLLKPEIATEFSVQYGYTFESIPDNTNILIIERLWQPLDFNLQEILFRLKAIKNRGIKLVYSIDDNLFEYFSTQASSWFHQQHLSLLHLFLYYADTVVVSTPALKKSFSVFHKNIIVIPNVLDTENIRQVKVKSVDKVRFGYLLSPDNIEYLFSILEELRAFLRLHKDQVDFYITGPEVGEITPELFHDLPVTFQYPPSSEYHKFWEWITMNCRWDFGLAPLIPNSFTECKSDIKFLDFTRLGFPGIYSDVAPYIEVKHHNAGLMASDNWFYQLEQMFQKNELREMLWENAKTYIVQERNIDIQCKQWKEIFNLMLSS